MRLLSMLLLVLLLLLQAKLWFGDHGRSKVSQLRETVAEQEQENEQLLARNAALRAEVEDLREGQQAAEERARTELGLVRPDETFYQLIVPPSPEQLRQLEREQQEAAGTPES